MVKMPEPMGGSDWFAAKPPAAPSRPISGHQPKGEPDTVDPAFVGRMTRWIAIYCVGFILTFGYTAASNTCDLARAEAFKTSCTEQAGLDAAITATVWPIYWPLSLSWSAFEAVQP